MDATPGPFDEIGKPAVLRYGTPEFSVVRPGRYVTCAVTGKPIPIDELRYWSVARQEAYVDSVAAFQAERRAR